MELFIYWEDNWCSLYVQLNPSVLRGRSQQLGYFWRPAQNANIHYILASH